MFPGLIFGLIQAPIVSNQWNAVEDTYIDTELSDFNFGRDGLLLGGKGTAILIRFPELDWTAGTTKPQDGEIVFNLTEQADVKLKSVAVITTPWVEGSGLRLPVPHAIQPDAQYRMGATWNNRAYGANGNPWDKPGAQGNEDARVVSGATVQVQGNIVRIKGIDQALLEMSAARSRNLGFKIEFENKVAFYSSEGFGPGPRLEFKPQETPSNEPHLAVIGLEPTDSGWTAKVKNLGKQVVTGLNATWSVRGEKKSTSSTQQALAPGDSVNISWQRANTDKSSPDVSDIAVQVNDGGPMSFREAPLTGLPVQFVLSAESKKALANFTSEEPEECALQRLVTYINKGILAQSRTSFSTEGCRERLRLVQEGTDAFKINLNLSGTTKESWLRESAVQAIRTLSPYSGNWVTPPDSQSRDSESFGWLPDTRDDTSWPTSLMLPNFPWGGPKALQNPLPERNLLSRAEVAALNEMASRRVAGALPPDNYKTDFKPSMPAALILSLSDMGGFPISDATVEAFQTTDGKLSTKAAFSGTTTSSGKVYLPGVNGASTFGEIKPDGSNSWMLVRVTRDFITETAWVSATSLATEFARGNVSVPTVEVKFPLGSGPLNESDDLASGKFVSDSNGGTPAQLAGLIDGDSTTVAKFEGATKPYWVEIDLGRDRLIGAIDIEFEGPPFARFDITVRPTGQREADAVNWFAETSGKRRAAEFSKPKGKNQVIRYVSSATRSRYIRLVYSGSEPISVANVHIRTIKQN